MEFKQWVEHTGGNYPEVGDTLIVLKDGLRLVRTGDMFVGVLPKGAYRVIGNDDRHETYTVADEDDPNKRYVLYWTRVDDAITNREVRCI